MRATALQLRRALWREAADRILLEEIEKLKAAEAAAAEAVKAASNADS